MIFRKYSTLFLTLAGLFFVFSWVGDVRAQSLSDVILSLDDRCRAVSQKSQASAWAWNQTRLPSQSESPIPPMILVEWTAGVGTDPDPEDIDDLDTEGKIAVLNQAIGVFQNISREYVNTAPDELANGSLPHIRRHEEGDVPLLPRATVSNYHEVLAGLAAQVTSLKVLPWIASFRSTYLKDLLIAYEEIEEDDEGVASIVAKPEGAMAGGSWKPQTIGANIGERVSWENLAVTDERFRASVRVSGYYTEAPANHEDFPETMLRDVVLKYEAFNSPSAAVAGAVPGSSERQIGGSAYLLSRSLFNGMSVSGAPASFSVQDASYRVVGSTTTAAAAITLIPDPVPANITGNWVGPPDSQVFVPAGMPSANPHQYYHRNWMVGCMYYPVFVPEFTRGLDVPAMSGELAKAQTLASPRGPQGEVMVQPRSSVLFGVDVGRGLNGQAGGLLGVRLLQHLSWSTQGWKNAPDPSPEETIPPLRFDCSYALQFIGLEGNYRVVYENDRSNRNPSAVSPTGMGWPVPLQTSMAWNTAKMQLAWDAPRIRQVAGRDLVIDVVRSPGHFGGYVLNIYRRPPGHTSQAPAGTPINVSGLTLLRSWTFSKPGATPGLVHPIDEETLITDNASGDQVRFEAGFARTAGGLGWLIEQEFEIDGQGTGQFFSWVGDSWVEEEGEWSWAIQRARDSAVAWQRDVVCTVQPGGFDFSASVSDSNGSDELSEIGLEQVDPFAFDAERHPYAIESGNEAMDRDTTLSFEAALQNGRLPIASTLESAAAPDVSIQWDTTSLLSSWENGTIRIEGSKDGTAFKLLSRQLDSQGEPGPEMGVMWQELLDAGRRLRVYRAPNGTTANRQSPTVIWSEVEYGTVTNGAVGLPRIVRHSDGTGTTFAWTIGQHGAYTLVRESGQLSGDSVVVGTREAVAVNASGFPTSHEHFAIMAGVVVKTSGQTFSDFNSEGAPQESTGFPSGLVSSFTWDSWMRITSHTNGLGVTTTAGDFDPLGRAREISWNGFPGTIEYSAFGQSVDYGELGSASVAWDGLGREVSSLSTRQDVSNSVVTEWDAAGGVEASATHSLFGTSETAQRPDGTLDAADSASLPFGGIGGDALAVQNGLLVTKRAVAGQPGTFEEVHTDSWGRPHKIRTPSRSGAAYAETTFTYSPPNATLQRVITNEPTGRVLITESAIDGTLFRSGIDVTGSGSLGPGDRYTETTTSVDADTITTILRKTDEPGPGVSDGLREVLRTDWTPATQTTETTVNGIEETITATAAYTIQPPLIHPTKPSITTSSSKDWTRTTDLNQLGLPTSNEIGGTGLPTTNLTPVWRADGSLAEVELTIGTATYSASFNHNGTLSSLSLPGRGNILGGHSISGGSQALTLDGTTYSTSLDGTSQSISGPDVIDQTRTLATHGGGYQQTIDPAAGAPTHTTYGAALAPTGKTYADNTGTAIGYNDELLRSITLARGGLQEFFYSDDGARDLTDITWPALPSGPFSIPGVAHVYTYNAGGRIQSLADSSGTRVFTYQRGRLKDTTYQVGPLAGYEIRRAHDPSGRHTGTALYRHGNQTPFHSIAQAPNGPSDQIESLSSGGIRAVPQRR